MGKIRLRGKMWYADYYYKGKRYTKAISKDKRTAEVVLKDIEVKIVKEEHLGIKATGKITFGSFLKKYLENIKADSGIRWYEEKKGFLERNPLKDFGNRYLQEITPELIEQYKAKRAQKVKPATINRELACIKHLFSKAVEWSYVSENPVKKVKFLKEPPGRIRYLEKEEINKLLEFSPSYLKPIIIVALNTGMRKGEILDLKWDNLDFQNKVIIVPITKSNETKIMPMNSIIYNTLKSLSRQGEHVFQRNGLKMKDIDGAFITAMGKANIKNFTFHDLRHTFASYLAMNGCNLKTIQTLMGHKTIAMTLRYAHLSQAHLENAVKTLEENFNSANLVATTKNRNKNETA